MRISLTRSMSVARRRGVLCAAVVVSLAGSFVPAQAQDFLGIFRIFSPPAARAPVYRAYAPEPGFPTLERPRYERRALRPRANVVRRSRIAHAEQPSVKPEPPKVPKKPGESMNPLPELMTDNTLRRGDIVMFPDGPKVFMGRPGARHTIADFASASGRGVASSTHKIMAGLKPGFNAAWGSPDPVVAPNQVAANTSDLTTTVSIASRRH